jgi:hypothetical protein
MKTWLSDLKTCSRESEVPKMLSKPSSRLYAEFDTHKAQPD